MKPYLAMCFFFGSARRNQQNLVIVLIEIAPVNNAMAPYIYEAM